MLCKVGTACPVAGVLSLFSQPCKPLSGWYFVKAALAWWDGQLPAASASPSAPKLFQGSCTRSCPAQVSLWTRGYQTHSRDNTLSERHIQISKRTLTKPTSRCFLKNPTSRSLLSANQRDAPKLQPAASSVAGGAHSHCSDTHVLKISGVTSGSSAWLSQPVAWAVNLPHGLPTSCWWMKFPVT